MSLAGYGNVANTIELGPCVGARFVRPDIVEPGDSICATKAGIDQKGLREGSHLDLGDTYRYNLSFQVTTEWLVRAGGDLPCGETCSLVFGSNTSQRLADDCSEFRSKATRSLKKKPSTCPPKM
jgi:hypothetical protein